MKRIMFILIMFIATFSSAQEIIEFDKIVKSNGEEINAPVTIKLNSPKTNDLTIVDELTKKEYLYFIADKWEKTTIAEENFMYTEIVNKNTGVFRWIFIAINRSACLFVYPENDTIGSIIFYKGEEYEEY